MGDGCDDQKSHCVECVVYSTAVFSKEECIRKNIIRPEPHLWLTIVCAMSAVIAEGHQEVPQCLSDYITYRSWSIFLTGFVICHCLGFVVICVHWCEAYTGFWFCPILCPNFVKAAILLFISVYYLSLQPGGMGTSWDLNSLTNVFQLRLCQLIEHNNATNMTLSLRGNQEWHKVDRQIRH